MVGFGWTVTGVVVSGTVIVAVGIVVTVTFTTWGGSVGTVISGVGVPDCIVLGSDSLTRGGDGVRAAGFFGTDWKVESGDWVWQDFRSLTWDRALPRGR